MYKWGDFVWTFEHNSQKKNKKKTSYQCRSKKCLQPYPVSLLLTFFIITCACVNIRLYFRHSAESGFINPLTLEWGNWKCESANLFQGFRTHSCGTVTRTVCWDILATQRQTPFFANPCGYCSNEVRLLKSNQFYSYRPKSQPRCLSGLYNLYSEWRPLSLDPWLECGKTWHIEKKWTF